MRGYRALLARWQAVLTSLLALLVLAPLCIATLAALAAARDAALLHADDRDAALLRAGDWEAERASGGQHHHDLVLLISSCPPASGNWSGPQLSGCPESGMLWPSSPRACGEWRGADSEDSEHGPADPGCADPEVCAGVGALRAASPTQSAPVDPRPTPESTFGPL